MIHGDLWKILVVEMNTSADKKYPTTPYFVDFVILLKELSLKRNLFY